VPWGAFYGSVAETNKESQEADGTGLTVKPRIFADCGARMPERGSFPPLKLRVNNWALSGQALIMTPNKQSAPNEFIGTCDLNDLAEHYKVEVRIVPAEDLDDKTARIKREAEDAKPNHYALKVHRLPWD